MTKETRHFMDEPDIGSGERTPAQEEIDREVASIKSTSPPPRYNPTGVDLGPEGRLLKDATGTHLARILAVKQEDETFEAQVFVRLTREPEVAETYIPAGSYPTEAEAWNAAEQRALRAFKENEF